MTAIATPNGSAEAQPAEAPAVSVKGLSKTYPGGIEALSDLSLEFPKGWSTENR